VTAEFGIVTDDFGDVTDEVGRTPSWRVADLSKVGVGVAYEPPLGHSLVAFGP